MRVSVEKRPCPACGTKCNAIPSETGKYLYVRCLQCKVMSMLPVEKPGAK